MIFSTFWFFIFFPIVIVLFYSTQLYHLRSFVLGIASLTFYIHFAGPAGVVPIVLLGIVTYFIGIYKRKPLLMFGISVCLLSLTYYKYSSFLISNITKFIPFSMKIPVSQNAKIIAPLAISFFVFEFVHYLYDIKRGASEIKNPIEFFHFTMFFPSLAAGPIKRFEQFIPSLRSALKSASLFSSDFQIGIARLIIGFSKKMIADSLTAYISYVESGFLNHPIETRWVILSAIAMRIYLDFSGYSDMAIGSAQCLGIRLPENFNWPYLATNLREFWRRWHISLSSWIRDYLYVPLGGNRKGELRRSANIIIAFTLCGLWHGAAMNFVLWGFIHGAGLVVQTMFESARKYLALSGSRSLENEGVRLSVFFSLVKRCGSFLISATGWLWTTFFVWSNWLFFFYSPDRAFKMLIALFRP